MPMVATLERENVVYQAVLAGELRIDPDGTIWRLGARRWNRWTGHTVWVPSTPRRAEHRASTGYLQVRVMWDGVRFHALAHRLVYRHFIGPIPDGLTINHLNGHKDDNRPENLEPATPSEQVIHALRVLEVGRDQRGEKNAMAKLTADQVSLIRQRRQNGERLASIAEDFGVSYQAISKVARGDRWA